MTSFLRKLRQLMRRSEIESEIGDELRFHLAQEAEELQTQGLSSEKAQRAARRDLGNVALIQEDTRAAWIWTAGEQFAQDIRYGLRTLSANKTFSSMAILSLALGIGANTAIFSFMDSILLRSLPVKDPQSLVILSWRKPNREFHGTNRHNNSYSDPKGGFIGGFFAYPAFELLRKSDSVFSSVFGYQGAGKLTLSFQGQSERTITEYVSGDYFHGLGTLPTGGRLIAPDDDRAGAPAVAVISFALSQRRMGGPEGAAGKLIRINNIPFTVIGVTPPEFFGADPDVAPDIYIPMHAHLLLEAGNKFDPPEEWFIDPTYDWVVPMARLRAGVTAQQAQTALETSFLEWARTTNPRRRLEETPRLVIREGGGGLDSLRRQYSKPLSILLTLVGLILAIACANIANLQLVRAAARKREIAVRLSVGAGRSRVIRQLLTESVLLALAGGALGIAFARWGIRFLTVLLANGNENFTLRADLNWNVLGVAAALSLVTGILFGLAPAVQSTRLDVIPVLKESRTGETRGKGRRLSLSRLLVVSQIALTLVILVAAGLFARTLSNLESIQLGFDRQNLLTFRVDARQAGHGDPEIVGFYEELRLRLSAIPGIRSVTLSHSPLIGQGTSATNIMLGGGIEKNSRILVVGAGFHSTMRIPIHVGREIGEQDRAGSAMVAVVNEAFAKLAFGDRNPIGQPLGLRRCPKCSITVVGVSASTLYGTVKNNAPPTVYLPYTQSAWGPVQGMVYELRTAGDPLRHAEEARAVLQRLDSTVPISDMKSQDAWIDQSINQEITFARLCTAFALLALAIACVGLYGTMSYNVARRTGEIGIRMALGAQRGHVVWMVLGEVALLAASGLVIGLAASLAASKLVEAFLFDMKPNDPLALAGSVATLVMATILAGYLPARNASRIDPLAALRQE